VKLKELGLQHLEKTTLFKPLFSLSFATKLGRSHLCQQSPVEGVDLIARLHLLAPGRAHGHEEAAARLPQKLGGVLVLARRDGLQQARVHKLQIAFDNKNACQNRFSKAEQLKTKPCWDLTLASTKKSLTGLQKRWFAWRCSSFFNSFTPS
jgi:hypothetical protein